MKIRAQINDILTFKSILGIKNDISALHIASNCWNKTILFFIIISCYVLYFKDDDMSKVKKFKLNSTWFFCSFIKLKFDVGKRTEQLVIFLRKFLWILVWTLGDLCNIFIHTYRDSNILTILYDINVVKLKDVGFV